MSVPQIAVLALVLIGGPILSVRVVPHGPKDDLGRPSRFLHWGFWGAILCFGLAMGADTLFAASPADSVPPIIASNVLMSVFYVSGCFYWTALGVLAHRLRSSWILWVVIGIATLAIGFVASYLMMASRVRIELATKENAA